MILTKEIVRDKLLAYLNQQMTLPELVNWAEDALYEGELREDEAELLRDIIARIGLADVQQFGLSWSDYADFLARLGYRAKVEAVPMPS
jgi:hypothetical protein